VPSSKYIYVIKKKKRYYFNGNTAANGMSVKTIQYFCDKKKRQTKNKLMMMRDDFKSVMIPHCILSSSILSIYFHLCVYTIYHSHCLLLALLAARNQRVKSPLNTNHHQQLTSVLPIFDLFIRFFFALYHFLYDFSVVYLLFYAFRYL